MSVIEFPDPSQAHLDPIPGIISFGSVNLLAGASGVGKTCLTATICTAMRDGAMLFGHPVNRPAAVGYVCADRGWTSAAYWLEKSGFRDIRFYSLADDPTFSPSRLRNKASLVGILGECLDKLNLPEGAFVVTDPLALFLGGNLNDYQSCAIALIEIRRLCTKKQMTLLGLAHASKQKADKREQYRRLQDRILGSSAQHGYGDTQMYLASPEETGEKFFTFLWHPHTAPAEIFPLGRNDQGMFIPWEGATQAAEEGAILAAIPEDYHTCVSWEYLLATSGASKSTLHRRLTELITEGLIERAVEGQYRRVKPN